MAVAVALLQNLGKVDRTADEIFDEHLTNFNRQHTCATRLQKEFSNYIRCVRAVQNASKSLMDAITEVYESQWTGSEVLYGQAKTIDTQYQQFSYKLADQVLKQLDTYALQFPEMKVSEITAPRTECTSSLYVLWSLQKKIDKRGRKLVDYDSQRHSFQSLQANAAKRKDDIKVTRGRDQLEEAKSTYEVLNSELHDELPALYDSRILFLVTNLQTLFACEQQFHSETSKVYADLEAIVDKLATESQRGSYTLKKINANSNPSSPQQSPVKANLSIVNNVTNGSANANGRE
uniref:BAR domain-containing protein n=1 Tax=Anopheles christyi TaxID=43041 RepID=A0A182KEQ7_9DIPT